jgi:hypothetical protein
VNRKTALQASALGVAVAALVLALPDSIRLAAVAAAATTLFTVYAVRQRNALRALARTLGGLMTTEEGRRVANGQADALDQHTQLLADQARALREHVEVDRAQALALATILDRMKQQKHESASALEQVEGHVTSTAEQVESRVVSVTDSLHRRLDTVDLRLGHAATQTEMRALHGDSLLAGNRDFRQVEALMGLHSLIQVRAPLPPSRGWAASPDILLHLVSLVLERRPRVVVELGGGLSTVWLAYAMETVGEGGRILSLDHDARFADTTRALLAAHVLERVAEVRHAPLKDIELDGELWPWYDLAALADVKSCDLLVVDGPPAATRDRARYPAIPILASTLSDSAIVVLDDYVRQDEKDIVSQWCERDPRWQVDVFQYEKGAAVLRRQA